MTGFGLLGHLIEMTKSAGVDAELDLNAIPLLAGALETTAAGITSSLQPQNVRLRRAIHNLEAVASDPRYPLLFDPQTSGGLLASVPSNQADACVTALRGLSYLETAIIGTVKPRSEQMEPVTILA